MTKQSTTQGRWWALALLSVAQFMVVLDIAVVNVALPSLQDDLGIAQDDLQWVVTAYALALGGFLMLGGRAADLFGRRRMLVAGLAVFGLASLVAGLAWDDTSLIGARGLQGLAAAIISPSALSLLTTTFREGRDRNVALGVWGAVGGLGGAAGVLLGGVLTDTVGWEWVFFVNLPVAAVAIALAPVILPESRGDRRRRFDGLGAILVTAGLSSAVLAISSIGEADSDTRALVAGAAAVVLLGAFVAVELRVADPLVSFRILRTRSVTAANVVGLAVTATVSSMFLMLTLYMQHVLGFSPMRAGLGYLAIAGTTVLWSTVASRLVSRFGPKPVLVPGLGLLATGLASFTRVPVDGTYARDLLPGFLVIAMGMSFSFVAVNVAALAGIEASDAGLASGLLGTSQQVGGALGIAVLSSIAVAHTDAAHGSGSPEVVATTAGLHAAFAAGALIALTGALVAALALRGERDGARAPGGRRAVGPPARSEA
jgi:EmrB/QacA subfamily drug resistance transporter